MLIAMDNESAFPHVSQRVVIIPQLVRDLALAISECEHDRIFVLTDDHTLVSCWPMLSDSLCLRGATVLTIPSGDIHKDLPSLTRVWEGLQKGGATRHSLLINLGGGMVTDLGGFAASTFKRGIDFINIPTTLLAMVDASVGGKTGINFGGLKNEIGVFNEARFVLLCTDFLATLDEPNLRSGYAEMLKHGLLSDTAMWAGLVGFDLAAPDFSQLGSMLARSVAVKERIVARDPLEQGLRKALNVGHTVGHALESLALKRTPVLHGYAVAYGIVAELYVSSVKKGFPADKLRHTVNFVREYYGAPDITCDDYPQLVELMRHDKKNTGKAINVTLLSDVGEIHINQIVNEAEVCEALDFLREG